MKNNLTLFRTILVILGIYSVYAAVQATSSRQRMASFVMLVIAAIFFTRAQRRAVR